MHLRISTTLIETFRKYRDTDYVSEEELVSSIKGEFVWRDEMKWGEAFHKILEKPEEHREKDGYARDGFFFPLEVVEPCLAVFNREGVFEAKHTQDFVIDGWLITVVVKADQLVGAEGIENKTKWGTFDPDQYIESFQWRYYTLILKVLSITYNVFLLSRYKDETFGLRGIERFTLYPYPKLEEECRELLTEFVKYIKRRGYGHDLRADRYQRSA